MLLKHGTENKTKSKTKRKILWLLSLKCCIIWTRTPYFVPFINIWWMTFIKRLLGYLLSLYKCQSTRSLHTICLINYETETKNVHTLWLNKLLNLLFQIFSFGYIVGILVSGSWFKHLDLFFMTSKCTWDFKLTLKNSKRYQ